MELDADLANELFDWIEPIRSQEHLHQLRVSDFPTLNQQARKKLHKDLYRSAYPSILVGEPKELTLEELARMSNG